MSSSLIWVECQSGEDYRDHEGGKEISHRGLLREGAPCPHCPVRNLLLKTTRKRFSSYKHKTHFQLIEGLHSSIAKKLQACGENSCGDDFLARLLDLALSPHKRQVAAVAAGTLASHVNAPIALHSILKVSRRIQGPRGMWKECHGLLLTSLEGQRGRNVEPSTNPAPHSLAFLSLSLFSGPYLYWRQN